MLRSLVMGVVVLLLVPACLLAAQRPNMNAQKTWGKQEKDAFYAWLKEQQVAPSAAASDPLIGSRPANSQPGSSALSNRYFSSRFVIYDMLGSRRSFAGAAPEQRAELDASFLGFEFQYGRPFSPWFRQLYNLGFYRGAVNWALEDGLSADFSFFRTGYQLELALLPPGIDRTRHIVFRGGLDLFYGRGDGLGPLTEGDLQGAHRRVLENFMLDQVTGLQGGLSWSVGYERQLNEDFLRLYGTIDGFSAFHLPDDPGQGYTNLGLALGISKRF
jgi:hypothetical protein